MFDDIHALLAGFDAEHMSREDWRHMLFEHGWRAQNDPYGYVLSEQGRLAGFIGTLYSRQTIRGRQRRFCNLSSWIVNKEHRLHGLRLLARVLDEGRRGRTARTDRAPPDGHPKWDAGEGTRSLRTPQAQRTGEPIEVQVVAQVVAVQLLP